MRRCSGIPCSAYLVLHSRDASPAASPAISSGRCRHPAPVSVGMYGGRNGGKFRNFLKLSFS
ncbi:unnamed protein product [Staurois parvus]|uniref:Uncharacterized protein n=1 Tax=Staurois parvus TaxID=386267 RepID=A0ABN9HL97_9NEOB|nr:unnamed protein product [Staurois parvus]